MLRVGFGYDAHRLVSGRPLVLGGVSIAYERGLQGHSDADVLLHAVCDALLGAAALGDLGQHFPDTEEQWRGVSSVVLLQKVAAMVRQAGFEIHSLDSSIVAQAPKVAAHLPSMISTIAGVLQLPQDRVSVKATTTEGMGFSGRGEGIAAYAVATLRDRPAVVGKDSGDD